MTTAQQEAWEANFEKDIQKISRNIVKELNKNAQRDHQYNLDKDNRISRWIKTQTGGHTESIQLWALFSPNEKIKWSIKYEIFIGGIDRGITPMSHNDVYNKKELERAYKSILLKIFQMVNNTF